MKRTDKDKEKDVEAIVKMLQKKDKEWFDKFAEGSLEKAIEKVYNIYKFSDEEPIFDELLEALAFYGNKKENKES